MSKFNVGDEVKVTHSGTGFVSADLGNLYTIISVDPIGYFGGIGYEVTPPYSQVVGEKSFTLVKSAPEVLENTNIKMITTFVPTWAKYMAMDSFGAWFVFNEEPVISTGEKPDWCKKGGNPVEENPPRFRAKIGECDPTQIEVPWQETLHEI